MSINIYSDLFNLFEIITYVSYISYLRDNPDDEIPRRISLQDYNWQNQFFVTLLTFCAGPLRDYN